MLTQNTSDCITLFLVIIFCKNVYSEFCREIRYCCEIHVRLSTINRIQATQQFIKYDHVTSQNKLAAVWSSVIGLEERRCDYQTTVKQHNILCNLRSANSLQVNFIFIIEFAKGSHTAARKIVNPGRFYKYCNPLRLQKKITIYM